MIQQVIRVGKAGWSLRKEHQPRFPNGGSHLERYAQRLPAVEINSSFRSWHRASSYERWAALVPADFRFSVKVHEDVTHHGGLEAWQPMARQLQDSSNLGEKLGAYLVQLPPSHDFEPQRAQAFFEQLRAATQADIVCEQRHTSWFGDEPEALLREHRVGRVAADPPPDGGDGKPGGWQGIAYYRLHGSPDMYYSAYDESELSDLADQLRTVADGAVVWCIFDNTAAGEGTPNTLALWERLKANDE